MKTEIREERNVGLMEAWSHAQYAGERERERERETLEHIGIMGSVEIKTMLVFNL